MRSVIIVVRSVSWTDIPDVTSGFRAYTREAALRLQVHSGYTYTLETIIQTGRCNLKTAHVPVRTNFVKRPSRLMKNMFEYVVRSAFTIVRISLLYRPLYFFSIVGAAFIGAGTLVGLRFLYYFFIFNASGKAQSVTLVALLITIGFIMFTWRS